LRQAGVPEKAVEALVRLCDTVTPGASRGIPVGPHASHLLAECVFDLIDRNLQAKGYIFCRFVDDIHIFCKTREQAHMAFYDLVNIINLICKTINQISFLRMSLLKKRNTY